MFHNIKLYLFGIVAFVMSAMSAFGVTITYDLDGGHLPSGETSYSVESNNNNNVILANPIKDDFIFAGWCKSDDYNNGECSSRKCVVGLENNGVYSVQWTVPCDGDTLTNDTTYIALWNDIECPEPNQNNSENVMASVPVFSNGFCVLAVESFSDMAYINTCENPELCDLANLGLKVMLCRETTPGDYTDCSQTYRICDINELYSLFECGGKSMVDVWCDLLGLEDCSTLFARHLSGVTEYTDELLSENMIDVCQFSGNTCTTQLSVLGVPMCMITDINDASDPALTIIHENGPYYINLVTEEDSENPAPLVNGSTNAIRIITTSGTYNVVGESPPSND